MSGRSLIDSIRYFFHNRRRRSDCVFCSEGLGERKIQQSIGAMFIIANDFPYVRWLGQKVYSHLMLVPQRHVLGLSNLTPDERLDFMRAVSEYEAAGYTFYLRAQADPTRSVPHLHGHFLALKR